MPKRAICGICKERTRRDEEIFCVMIWSEIPEEKYASRDRRSVDTYHYNCFLENFDKPDDFLHKVIVARKPEMEDDD